MRSPAFWRKNRNWEIASFKRLLSVKMAWNQIFSRLGVTWAEHDVSVQVCNPSNAFEATWCGIGCRTPWGPALEHWAQDLWLLFLVDTNLFKTLVIIQELCSFFYAFVPHFSSHQELEGNRNNWGADHEAEVSPDKAVAKPQFSTATCSTISEYDLGERGWLSCISCLLGKVSMTHVNVSVMELWSDEAKHLIRRVFSCQTASQSFVFLTFSFVLCIGLMNGLAKQGLLGNGQNNLPATAGLDDSMCFHVVPYTETLLQTLGRSNLWEMHCSGFYKVWQPY